MQPHNASHEMMSAIVLSVKFVSHRQRLTFDRHDGDTDDATASGIRQGFFENFNNPADRRV